MSLSTTQQFINDAESALGARFPDSFRFYLLQSNGGELEILDLRWEINPVLDTTDHDHERATAIDVIRETAAAREWRGFPSRGVAIGSDGCGNYLIFQPDDHDPSLLFPAVYIWWHEGGELELAAADFSMLRL